MDDTLPPEVSIPLKKFLTFQMICPPRWRGYDLYLVRDEQVTFYVGQSQCAFDRLWHHLRGGPKGRALLGRFILANWPRSGSWIITLLSAGGARFAAAGHDRDAAERQLIEELKPCLNVSCNERPAPIPDGYLPPNAPVKNLRSFRRMLREAAYARRTAPEDSDWER